MLSLNPAPKVTSSQNVLMASNSVRFLHAANAEVENFVSIEIMELINALDIWRTPIL